VLSRLRRILPFAAAVVMLAAVSSADARAPAKFKVSSVSGTTTSTQDGVYEPTLYTSCTFTQTEEVSFQATKSVTAYAFATKTHGRLWTAWSDKPAFRGNLFEVEIPGQVTVTRSAVYNQVNYTDPETGEVSAGCHDEVRRDLTPPVDCTVSRTFKATLRLGGTSDTKHSTYVVPELSKLQADELDNACETHFSYTGRDPRLFERADLFAGRQKRLSDSDRVHDRIFIDQDYKRLTGSIDADIKGTIKRSKRR